MSSLSVMEYILSCKVLCKRYECESECVHLESLKDRGL